MALVTEVLLVSGVALDLVGAGVLSHAHNAESIVELREDIGEEGAAVGEPDALSTHAQLLAEKRIGFLLLTVGLVLYLSGLVLKSPEGLVMMGSIAGGVVVVGLVTSVVFTRVVGNRTREQARRGRSSKTLTCCPSSSDLNSGATLRLCPMWSSTQLSPPFPLVQAHYQTGMFTTAPGWRPW